MLKKLLTLCLVAVILSVTAFASPEPLSEITPVFTETITVTQNDGVIDDVDGLKGSIALNVQSSASYENAIIVTTVFDGAEFLAASITNAPLTSGENPKTITLPEAKTEANDSYDVKFYLWESKGTLKPLAQPATAEVTPQAPAQPEIEYWDGKTTTQPQTDAEGAFAGYYKITSGAELAWLAKNADMASNAYLANDIYLNEDGSTKNNWESYQIGSNDDPFTGVFDGNGNTIYNYYYADASAYGGMWRQVKGGSIKNLIFENAKFVSTTSASSGRYSAIVCGEAIDGEFDSITVSGSAEAESGKYLNSFASIVGYSKISAAGEAVVINNCVNNLTIDASAAPEILASSNNVCLAGIAGKVNSGTTITNCTNNAAIYGPKTPNVGGIAGYFANGNTIDNCKNTAEITGYDKVGQICGKKGTSATITNSDANTGTVVTTK